MMKKIIFGLLLFFSLFFVAELNALTIYSKKDQVYVGGETVGLKLDTGVIVAKTFAINDGMHLVKPWSEAGLKEKDIILTYNNYEIKNSDDLMNALKKSGTDTVLMTVIRGDEKLELTITPYLKDDSYSLGIYIKDNVTGVGTLTYIIPSNHVFGALGHQIDGVKDTTGKLLEAKIIGINKAIRGEAGSKKAQISTKALGTIAKNTITGIHGTYTANIEHKLIYIAKKEEVKKGEASIITSVDNNIKEYRIEIIEVLKQNTPTIKGIKFKVVDEELLSKTGGIIQGMSGSPIIQNGKLIGAVTHVLVNNPEEGYGIFIEFMLSDMGIDVI
jgi:stage IV sporulation protein B